MKQLLLMVMLCFHTGMGIIAQDAGATVTTGISGRVAGKGHALEFATVALLSVHDATVVKTTLTDRNGAFSFQPLEGTYQLTVDYLGYQRYLSDTLYLKGNAHKALGEIQLQPKVASLKEVVVKDRKAMFERKPDRLVFNLQNNLVTAGDNILDVLKMSPGVMVDGNDNITVNGKSGVRFMIDGRSTYLRGDQLKEYLKSISSDNVKSIEIISNPPARYEAEGTASIINIILKKGTRNGYNGNVYTRYHQGIYGNYGVGGNLNVKQDALNLFLNYDHSNSVSISDGEELRRYGAGESKVYFNQRYLEKYNTQNNFIRAGLDYQLSEHHLAGLIVDATLVDKDKAYTGETQASFENKIDSSFHINNGIGRNFRNINANVNYRLLADSSSKTLDINYDFSWFSDRQLSDYATTFSDSRDAPYRPPEILKGNNPTGVNIHSLKLDYENKRWLKGELSLGLKVGYVRTDNEIVFRRLLEDAKWILDSGRTDHFIYKENISAVYGSWSRSLQHWKIQAGLRFEHTVTKGNSVVLANVVDRSYSQLFPSLFVVRDLDDRQQLGFSYSRRIGRPDYASLNPFEFYFDPYSYKKGNPYLSPELSNSLELSYTLDGKYAFTLAYIGSADVISEISRQDDSTRILEYTYENLRTQHNYSANFSAPVAIREWWNAYANITGYVNVFDSQLSGGDLYKKQWSYSAYVSNTFSLSETATAQLSLYYMSPFVRGINNYESLYNVSAGFRKLLCNKKLSITMRVSDIFRRQREKGKVDFQNQYILFRQFHDSRRLSISLGYNFGRGAKFRVRKREAGNEDEKNRVAQ